MFERKISAFAASHNVAYELQRLKFSGIRAIICSGDLQQHETLLRDARRIKGMDVRSWTCYDGGAWEGRVYLQDSADAERCKALTDAEMDHVNAWYAVYHKYLVAGMCCTEAAAQAEREA